MAEKLVISLIVKLGTMVEKEAKLENKIRNDIKSIKNELQMIVPILRAADATKEIKEDLQAWLQQVRDAASSSEDVFDELVYYLACPSSFSYQAEKLLARHRIDSAISQMTREYKDISERGKRYQSLSSGLISYEHGRVIPNPQEEALFKTEAHLVGIEGPKKKLLELLLNKTSNTRVIPVVGMGGIGKSTLVKQIYDDAKVKKLFHSHAWINVSQNFKLEALLKDLIRQLCSEIKKPFPDDMESMNCTQLKQRLHHELLNDKKYEIVVDDVWSIEAWQAIKNVFPENQWGSRVIITTRNTDVASESCKFGGPGGTIFNLAPLSIDDESLTLLRKIVFSGDPCPDHLLDDARGILKKCAGLPLAIVVISGVLINKDKATNAEWSKINRKLPEILKDNKDVHKILSLSYYDLPHYLKSCFLHMGMFPEDHLIGRRRLIRMWIAEGFADEKVDEIHTAEDVAKRYLKELLSRNMIQAAERRSDGMIKTYQIHDLFMELIHVKSREHNFATIKKANSASGLGKVHRLSMHKSLLNTEQMQIPQLVRSFMIFDVEESLTKTSMPTLFSRAFKLLVVLDLQGANIDQFPTCVTYLFNLKYLSLKDSQVDSIPSSIGNLRKLQTLDLKGTLVSRLPSEIQGLTQLRNLLVYRNKLEEVLGFHSKSGFIAPKRLGRLEFLRVLCFVEAGHRNDNVICEVGKLTALRRLGIVKLTTENNPVLCTSISRLSNLHALSITSSESEKINLKMLTAPVTSLRRLYLTGKLEAFPDWLPRFEKLVKIFLKSSNLPADPLETLERLPNLVHIEFSKVYDGEVLHFKAGKFPNLKNLGLHRLDSLKTVIMEQSAMPGLERFILQGCPMLKILPQGIEHLSKLKVLDLVYMPHELIAKIETSSNHPGPDYPKVRHIPEVNNIYKVDGIVETSRLNFLLK